MKTIQALDTNGKNQMREETVKTEKFITQSTDYGALLLEYMQHSAESGTMLMEVHLQEHKTLLDMRCELTCASHYMCGGIAADICTTHKAWVRSLKESSCSHKQLPSAP
jgi:hypothetical protein